MYNKVILRGGFGLIIDYQKLLDMFPDLLLDEIQCLEERTVGWKQIESGDPFFGDKSANSEVPNCLVLKALVQCGKTGVLTIEGFYDSLDPSSVNVSIETARFFHPIKIGDKLRVEVESRKSETQEVHQKGKAFVDDNIVAEASWIAHIKRPGKFGQLRKIFSRKKLNIG